MPEEHDPQLESLLREQGRGSFGPGFADRVMRRIDEEPAGWLDALAPAAFLRVAAAATAVVAVLVAFSLSGAADRSQTAIEAVLGLEPVTARSIYDAQALMGAFEEEAS